MTRTVPGHVDSLGKLLERLQLVSREEVTYNGKRVREIPSEFYVSPALLRYFECTHGCTACCLPFTLDFTPDEFDMLPKRVAGKGLGRFYERVINVSGTEATIKTYDQYKDDACPYLTPNRRNGTTALGCGFYEKGPGQPMECHAAPQVLMTSRGPDISMITSRPFGRGWAWKDKPQCVFHPVADKLSTLPDDAQEQADRKALVLERYLHWADHVNITTVLPEAIEATRNLPALLRDNGMRTYQYA